MTKLLPYLSPMQESFGSVAFRARTRAMRARVRAHALREGGVHDAPWIRFHAPGFLSGANQARRRRQWNPKLYVCVASSQYWHAVDALVDALSRARVTWKFWIGRDYRRPDKIVIYPEAERVAEAVALVRRTLGRFASHRIHHAALASEYGLEPAGARGIYVGLDPDFLGPPWRYYRCLCAAWLSLNRDWLETQPGGQARWIERMNLSRTHQGPATLRPKPADRAYVRRAWRAITE